MNRSLVHRLAGAWGTQILMRRKLQETVTGTEAQEVEREWRAATVKQIVSEDWTREDYVALLKVENRGPNMRIDVLAAAAAQHASFAAVVVEHLQSLRDEPEFVRDCALLRRVGTLLPTDALCTIAFGPAAAKAPFFRLTALLALAERDGPDVREAIRAGRRDQSPEVRVFCSKVLETPKEKRRALLSECLVGWTPEES